MDISATIQSQYACSPKIMALAQGFADLIDPEADLQLFYDKVFNIDTAQGVALSTLALTQKPRLTPPVLMLLPFTMALSRSGLS